MPKPARTIFEYHGIGLHVETRFISPPSLSIEYLIFAFGRVLETRRVDGARFDRGAGAEAVLVRTHHTVLAAVRSGRFDRRLEALGREVFGAERRSAEPGPSPLIEVAGDEESAVPRSLTAEPLAVELSGSLPAAPGTRLELVIRAFLRGSGTPVAEARIHAQLLAEGAKVRASLSGVSDASGRLGLRVQLPSSGPSSLALRVEHGGETILLRQELCAG